MLPPEGIVRAAEKEVEAVCVLCGHDRRSGDGRGHFHADAAARGVGIGGIACVGRPVLVGVGCWLTRADAICAR